MNGYHNDRELPELTDDQIRLLDSICKAASRLIAAPFKALVKEYETHFQRDGRDTRHDNAVFRWVMRIGETARRDYRLGSSSNFTPYLRELLVLQGITVIDDEDEVEIDGHTGSLGVKPSSARQHPGVEPRRRVSFDDARLEETWLSERSQFAGDGTNTIARGLLNRPPRRAGVAAPEQRPRSVNGTERHPEAPGTAPKHFQHPSQSPDYTSEFEDEQPRERHYGDEHDVEEQNPTLFLDPSRTQLENNAGAFRDITLVRRQRQCLHILHDVAVRRQQDCATAYAHDYRLLLQPAWNCLLTNFLARRQERQQLLHLEQIFADFQPRKKQQLLSRAFSHWQAATRYQRGTNELAKGALLARKYFRKWRDIAVENLFRSRSILTRKFLRRWQLQAARKAIEDEMRFARHEEFLMRKYLHNWRLQCRSRWAEPWRDTIVEHHCVATLHFRLQQRGEVERLAAQHRTGRLARYAFQELSRVFRGRQQASHDADNHFGRRIASRCIRTLGVAARLKPAATALSLSQDLGLKRKALSVWYLHLQLNRQAAEVDRKRILQSAWTSWNDALRCKALARRTDERLVRQSLSSWVLRTRLHSFLRVQNDRRLHRIITEWQEKAQQTVMTLDQAEIAFAEGQRRRRLRYGMLRLHITMRNREDAMRAAVEFSNSRALPDVLDVWRQRTHHIKQLSTWAKDARFYVLCTQHLKIWQKKTIEHQHQRRRQAYARVRARIKIRIVRQCFARLRTKSTQISSARQDATGCYQARLFRIGTESFDIWRQSTSRHFELELQAQSLDRQKLLTSAISALVAHHADLVALHQQADLLQQESDMALQASALRKMQWATFTAIRRIESADALLARNRDLHVKQMLRHWAMQALANIAQKSNAKQREPESPSLRPASRLAARSVERPLLVSSPPTHSATPGYLRTPSRSRRMGRFRPLPTPAHVTPMAFDKSYFVTTPAPFTIAQAAQSSDPEETDVFDGLTPQITPFARKLRAGGIGAAPPSALRSSMFGRSVAGGTGKSVRFAGSSRFGSGQRKLNSTEE